MTEVFGCRRLRCRRWSALLVVLCCTHLVSAQEDTTALYRNIYDYSQKHGVTRWIYQAIFAEPEVGKKPPAPMTPSRRVNKAVRYRGKIVRSIQVTVTDPFGFSVDDTTQAPVAWIQRAGNSMHITSRHYVIRDLLLIRQFEELDPLEVTESERLLRASPIVTDARITVHRSSNSKDSVDVYVVVHDKWNYDVSAEGDLSTWSGTARDRNFLGLGQELEQRVVYGTNLERPELSGQHRMYNIENTYISTLLQYRTSASSDLLNLGVDRPFYSPLTRMAGNLSLGKTWNHTPLLDSTGEELGTLRVNTVNFDTWIGRSFPLSNDGSEPGRSSNIVGGLRYYQTRYPLRPGFETDTLRINGNASTWLASAGLSVRQYYQERYLFRFGVVEDVPEGLLITATSGVRKLEYAEPSAYAGVGISRGRYLKKFGYLSAFAEYGTYWEEGHTADATLHAGFLYFSDLMDLGRWHFRQFVRGDVLSGFGKPVYSSVNLNGDQLYGFSSNVVSGVHKEVLRLETVAYAPYHILGFRFAPVLLFGFGTIGQESDPLFSGRIYNAINLGILVRNENLLVKTFEVSLSFYPFIPEDNGAVLEVGSFNSFALNARTFAFTRPDVVGY